MGKHLMRKQPNKYFSNIFNNDDGRCNEAWTNQHRVESSNYIIKPNITKHTFYAGTTKWIKYKINDWEIRFVHCYCYCFGLIFADKFWNWRYIERTSAMPTTIYPSNKFDCNACFEFSKHHPIKRTNGKTLLGPELLATPNNQKIVIPPKC